MEFRKMFKTLYAEQEKRHRFIEQSFRLCGRRRGWDVSREQHRNMYTIKGEIAILLKINIYFLGRGRLCGRENRSQSWCVVAGTERKETV